MITTQNRTRGKKRERGFYRVSLPSSSAATTTTTVGVVGIITKSMTIAIAIATDKLQHHITDSIPLPRYKASVMFTLHIIVIIFYPYAFILANLFCLLGSDTLQFYTTTAVVVAVAILRVCYGEHSIRNQSWAFILCLLERASGKRGST